MRRSDYCDGDNCSIAQIRDGTVYIGNKRLLNIGNPTIDYVLDKMLFFYQGDQFSLNQAPGAGEDAEAVYFKLNTGHEILKAFEEIEKQNVKAIKGI